MKIGRKTLQVLEFVSAYIRLRGYAPSYREIAAACSLKSTSGAGYHLDRLVAVCYLRREPGRPRALVVVTEGAKPRALDALKDWQQYG